jgi:N-carbamoyl-L-amino-acid hydrolase
VGGTFTDGVSRIAYSDADIEGRRYVMGLMTAAGLQPRIDPAGNIFGQRAGTEPQLRPILFGSHIDSVPSGGNFDGDLGSLSALGAMEALDAAGIRTRHPLEMVVWAHEEGFAFGRGLACSRIVAGEVTSADMNEVWNGHAPCRRDPQDRRQPGSDPRRAPAEGRAPLLPGASHRAGRHARARRIPSASSRGSSPSTSTTPSSPASRTTPVTTPIAERHDAMLAAAHLTVAVRDAVTRLPGRQVGTVGHIEVMPNSPNVIPGLARLSIELRDLSSQKLVAMMDDIRARGRARLPPIRRPRSSSRRP